MCAQRQIPKDYSPSGCGGRGTDGTTSTYIIHISVIVQLKKKKKELFVIREAYKIPWKKLAAYPLYLSLSPRRSRSQVRFLWG